MVALESPTTRLALPKGRMSAGVHKLLGDAGIAVRATERGYRPSVTLDGFETKILKPQNIVEMLHAGSRDVGFAGADWVAELEADVVEILDTELDRVRVVAAAPEALAPGGALPQRKLVVASEYERLTRGWIERRGCGDGFIRSYGATEVFPPEDADIILDVAATGATLRDNGLVVVGEVMTSSTRLYAHPRALDDARRREAIEQLRLLLGSVLAARKRVMLEVNVAADRLDAVVASLPCMRQPTIARLHGEDAYAVKAAVPREALPRLILDLKAQGGTDIVVAELAQIIL
jgi:ATP phosphoribosyltransferase